MDRPDLGPGDRRHLGRRVELHGAGAERDHRGGERQVARLQALDVAQHLVLGVEGVEHRVRQVVRRPRVRRREIELGPFRQALGRQAGRAVSCPEDREQILDVGGGGRLVERDADRPLPQLAQVDPPRLGGGQDLVGGALAGAHAQGVEEGLAPHGIAEMAQPLGQRRRQGVHPAGDRLQPLGAVVDGVHARHHGEEHLGRADVAGGLLAADVLLAGLHRHAQGGLAPAVARDADDPPRNLALVLLAGGEERRVRPAVAHGDAEPLRRADRDVGAEFARRPQQGQRQQVGRHHYEGAGGVGLLGDRGVVHHPAVGRRVLEEDAEEVPRREVDRRRIADPDVDADRAGAGLDHLDRLRMAVLGDEEDVPLAIADGVAEMHRLGRGGALVEQRGVGDRQPGQVGYHGLEVEQRLEAPLRDLRLVGGVLGVPARVLQDVALDHPRRDAAVVAHAEEGTEDLVPAGDAAQGAEQLLLAEIAAGGEPGEVERRLAEDRLGDGLAHQLGERAGADHLQHLPDLPLAGAQVAADEGVGGIEDGAAGLRRRAGEITEGDGAGRPGRIFKLLHSERTPRTPRPSSWISDRRRKRTGS